MTDLYKHLEEKNYWYKKYLACTEAFLVALKHAPELALDELELFYGNRESLLKILDGLDVKIDSILGKVGQPARELRGEERTRVQHYLREKDSIVARIVDLDRVLMEEIDGLRVKGEAQLKLLAKGKRALAKYKSAGRGHEKLDKRV